jgi:hypothetical protein
MWYDIIIWTAMVLAIGGTIWASVKIERARRAGKIRYIGKVIK